MQTLPLPASTEWAKLDWFTQTSMVGGVSVTEHTALAVMPQRPRGPSVVMMLTAADRYAIASRNSLRVLSLFMSCSPVHAKPSETPEYNGLNPESCCASLVIAPVMAPVIALSSGRFAGHGELHTTVGPWTTQTRRLHPVMAVECRDPGRPVCLLDHIRG